ncbi:type VII secretion protein EccE [Nocardia sp. NPDC127526]|uniref:type VII secretion protein EccE n=1 Tax=Nocardia sp. NPDC127526 TaxID=3345393 RepID=UPI003642C402
MNDFSNGPGRPVPPRPMPGQHRAPEGGQHRLPSDPQAGQHRMPPGGQHRMPESEPAGGQYGAPPGQRRAPYPDQQGGQYRGPQPPQGPPDGQHRAPQPDSLHPPGGQHRAPQPPDAEQYRGPAPEETPEPRSRRAPQPPPQGAPQPPPAPNPSPAELRSDDMWLFRMMPLRLVVPVVLIGVTASLVAVAFDSPWWGSLIAGIVPALIGLLPVGGIPIGLRIGRWVAYRWRQARRGTLDEPTMVDVPLPEGGSYGLRWDGSLLTMMLRIDPPPDTLTLLRRGSLDTDQVLPLAEIASCLRQYDVELDSADVISTGTRTASTEAVLSGYAATIAPLGRLYDEILGPLPAIAHRTVWLVLRLNPLANSKAVNNRGGGPEGALRAAIIATRRVANRLAARGITASVLTTSEMTAAMRELTRGIPVDDFTETAKSLEHNGIHLTTFQIDPELFNSDGLAKIWAVRSLATTVTVRLRPAKSMSPYAGADTENIEVDARVRYDTNHELDEAPILGLRELPRRQLWALADTLSFGAQEVRPGGYRGPLEALSDISVPTAGCGQLIGADATGSGIAVPLIGNGSRRIDIISDLHLAQQVILRAIALGAGAVVHTARPGAWQGMIANVGATHALSLASSVTHSSRGSTMNARAPHPAATVIVFDGVPATAPPGSATVVTVHETLPPDYQPDADVTIVQHPNAPHTVTVHTPATKTTAMLVTTPAEQHYLGAAARA